MYCTEMVRTGSRVINFDSRNVCVVDQFLNNKFNLNDCGWLRNDLAALAAASTREQYEEILRRLKELPATSSIVDGTKLKDAFDLIKPRSVQTESEFVEFAGFLTEKGIKNAEAAYAAELAKKSAVVEKTSEESTDE